MLVRFARAQLLILYSFHEPAVPRFNDVGILLTGTKAGGTGLPCYIKLDEAGEESMQVG